MRLLVASLASAAVVLAAPFMGQVQTLLRASLSTAAYVAVLGVMVGGALVAAIAMAFLRIRERRRFRLLVMAGAFVIGAVYTSLLSTGDTTIDAVERFHFVEYGAIAVLFYRVWRPAADLSTLLLPVLCGLAVGTLDEWLQWFIPYRVGETKDVLLNLTAIVCGLLFGVALEPPRDFTWRLRPVSARRLALVTSMVIVVFAGFIHSVHLGHELHADGIGRFKSGYTMDELEALQGDRDARWRADPPVGLRRLSREDQYLDEALWHVRERNRRWDEGDITTAFHENLILERFFTPVLDHRTYVSPDGVRWAPAQRADAAARGGGGAGFISRAEPRPILAWNKTLYWTGILAAALVLVVTGFRAPTGR
jgi:VanZ family protein